MSVRTIYRDMATLQSMGRRFVARAASKINSALLEGDREKFAQSPLLAFSNPNQETAAVPFLSSIRLALRERLLLCISYRDLKGKLSTRDIRPLGPTVFDRVWLFTAWCESRSDFRNFRMV